MEARTRIGGREGAGGSERETGLVERYGCRGTVGWSSVGAEMSKVGGGGGGWWWWLWLWCGGPGGGMLPAAATAAATTASAVLPQSPGVD
jgi:hypothetical protein